MQFTDLIVEQFGSDIITLSNSSKIAPMAGQFYFLVNGYPEKLYISNSSSPTLLKQYAGKELKDFACGTAKFENNKYIVTSIIEIKPKKLSFSDFIKNFVWAKRFLEIV